MAKKLKVKADAYTLHNKVRVIRGGADYFAAVQDIADKAVYSLHLQTYIFDEDETGTRVADALIRAAQRKVQVFLLLDGYASGKLSKPFIARLRRGGVNCRFFAPMFRGNFFYMGRRMHHKIMVADAHTCLVAGINISDRYNDIGDVKAWLDWSLYAEGEVARGINTVCVSMWNRSVFRRKCRVKIPGPIPLPQEECEVRIRRNDWVYNKTEITKSYRELFMHAHSHVTVMTSYFWPPEKLLRHMADASRRGVQIRLILTGNADVPFAKYTERYLYRWLFRNKVQVYEYQQNVLHGKIAVCDNELVTVGSYNVNNISAFASVELNLDVRSNVIAQEVGDKFAAIISTDCIQITEADFKLTNNAIKRFFYYLSYKLVHIVFYFFTFYYTQKRGRH